MKSRVCRASAGVPHCNEGDSRSPYKTEPFLSCAALSQRDRGAEQYTGRGSFHRGFPRIPPKRGIRGVRQSDG